MLPWIWFRTDNFFRDAFIIPRRKAFFSFKRIDPHYDSFQIIHCSSCSGLNCFYNATTWSLKLLRVFGHLRCWNIYSIKKDLAILRFPSPGEMTTKVSFVSFSPPAYNSLRNIKLINEKETLADTHGVGEFSGAVPRTQSQQRVHFEENATKQKHHLSLIV